jgi:hypothetical protein
VVDDVVGAVVGAVVVPLPLEPDEPLPLEPDDIRVHTSLPLFFPEVTRVHTSVPPFMPVLVPAFLHAPPSLTADTTLLVPTTVDTTSATTTATRFTFRDTRNLLIHAATPPRSVNLRGEYRHQHKVAAGF